MQIDTEQSQDLISAEKVDGTAVYGADKSKIGNVKSVMIGKRDGQVHHAVLSIGGFLGMGEKYHSIPWNKLAYDTDLGGYKLDATEEQLKGAPTFEGNQPERAYDREFQTQSYGHYNESPIW